jgi:putative inorganic carbon (hco3(-)) transporter
MRSIVFSIFFVGFMATIAISPYCGVLLWWLVSFMSPQRIMYGFAQNIPLAIIVAIPALVAWLVSREPKLPPFSATAALIVAFMAYYSVTTALALVPDLAALKWEETLKSHFFVLVTLTMLTNRVRIHALIWVIAISIAFYGAKSGTGTILSGGGGRVWGPPDTIIGDNNHFGVALLIVLPLLNYLRVNSAVRALRIAIAIVMGLCLIAVLASYSRGALIALAAISVFLWLKSQRKIVPGIVIAAAITAAISFMPEQWFERMNSIEHYEQDSSANSRLAIWRAAADIGVARPLTGSGFLGPYDQQVVSSYSPGTQARAVHSIYFEVIGEQGLLAFVIWLMIPLVAWRNGSWIIQRTRDRPEFRWANDLARMIQVSLVAYLTGGAFLSLSYWDLYFTIVVIIAALRKLVADQIAEPRAIALPGRNLPMRNWLPGTAARRFQGPV